ncbi:Ubiquitin-conjugating enzyme E2 2 [Nosema granulosis]|uniref:Ubiquitin-conjugating enzyme E2 2 n=1 Tax=Nosema granulosis TaxID=83296 RepID=A0A9P6L0C0_9MICR|nr:Ubiquitin-conjugating enzyme E2 2 [Nosema granulosis]
MMTPAQRRLMKDLNTLKSNNERTIFAQPLDDDIFTWVAIILGPEDTPYEDGTFSLVLMFDETYPQKPPHIKFISEMFHPNIYTTGELCLDMLKNRWSPSYDILGILVSIQSLLNDPNVLSPANVSAAEVYQNDIETYNEKVSRTVEKSWMDIDQMKEKYI